jgi:hypothetical protein
MTHPFGPVAAFDEGFHHLHALDDLLGLQFRLGGAQFLAQRLHFAGEVHFLQQAANGLGADAGNKAVLAIFVLGGEQFVLGQQVELLHRRQAGLDDDILFEIEHTLQILQLHVEQHADAAGQ